MTQCFDAPVKCLHASRIIVAIIRFIFLSLKNQRVLLGPRDSMQCAEIYGRVRFVVTAAKMLLIVIVISGFARIRYPGIHYVNSIHYVNILFPGIHTGTAP